MKQFMFLMPFLALTVVTANAAEPVNHVKSVAVTTQTDGVTTVAKISKEVPGIEVITKAVEAWLDAKVVGYKIEDIQKAEKTITFRTNGTTQVLASRPVRLIVAIENERQIAPTTVITQTHYCQVDNARYRVPTVYAYMKKSHKDICVALTQHTYATIGGLTAPARTANDLSIALALNN